MADIVPYLELLCARFEQPEMQKVFQGFSRTMQFTFPDLQRNFTLRIAQDGSVAWEEQTALQPDVRVTTNSDILVGIIDRSINPIHAYITFKLKVAGQMEDLLKLQKLL